MKQVICGIIVMLFFSAYKLYKLFYSKKTKAKKLTAEVVAKEAVISIFAIVGAMLLIRSLDNNPTDTRSALLFMLGAFIGASISRLIDLI